MIETKLKVKVCKEASDMFSFEFGKVRADMWISSKGKAAKELKLKDEDMIEMILKKM